jgi:hypothetical protein
MSVWANNIPTRGSLQKLWRWGRKSRGKSKETKNECTNEQLQKIRIKTIWTAKNWLEIKIIEADKKMFSW